MLTNPSLASEKKAQPFPFSALYLGDIKFQAKVNEVALLVSDSVFIFLWSEKRREELPLKL